MLQLNDSLIEVKVLYTSSRRPRLLKRVHGPHRKLGVVTPEFVRPCGPQTVTDLINSLYGTEGC